MVKAIETKLGKPSNTDHTNMYVLALNHFPANLYRNYVNIYNTGHSKFIDKNL